MAVFTLRSFAQSDVPQDESEPVSADLALFPSQRWVFLAGINHGLEADCGPVAAQLLDVRVHLEESFELKHILHTVRRHAKDDLRYQNCDSVLERVVLELRVVIIVQVDRDVDVQGLNQIVKAHLVFLVLLFEWTTKKRFIDSSAYKIIWVLTMEASMAEKILYSSAWVASTSECGMIVSLRLFT